MRRALNGLSLGARSFVGLPFLSFCCVGLVYVLPMLVAGREGISAQTAGAMLGLVSASIVIIVAALPAFACWILAGVRERWSVLPIPLLILFLCPIVSTLPGMVLAHRELFGGYSYQRNIVPSVMISALNVIGFSTAAVAASLGAPRAPVHVPWRSAALAREGGREAPSPDSRSRARKCLSLALIVASATNLIFPWLPLD